MPSEFDWRTEEERGWDEVTPAEPSRNRGLPRLKPGQIIVGLTGLAGLLIIFFLLVENRQATNSERMRADVLASHEILIGALQKRDTDRFISMLSDKAVAWRQLQVEIVRRQLVLSRRPLGFMGPVSPSAATETSPTHVILSAQLDRAEVKDVYLYDVLLSNGLTKNVRLEQTFYYVLDGASWLLADADEDGEYWGQWHRVEGDRLTLAYPERDADLGARLSANLDTLLSTICTETAVNCPKDFHLLVRLDPSQRSLMHLQEGPFATDILSGYGPETVNLPAPTLVGRPVDEDGFDALYQGYASWLAAVMLTNYSSREQFDDAMLAEQLTDWGLIPVPSVDQPVPFRVSISFPSDVSPPKQDIMMLCSNTEQMRLIQYQFADGEWINRSARIYAGLNLPFSGYPVAQLSRLADYNGALYFLHEPVPDGSTWRLFLWQDGSERLLIELDQPLGLWPVIVQPDSNKPENNFVMYQIHSDESNKQPDIWNLPILDCLEGDCQLEKMNGLPIYSPSSEYTLVVKPGSNDQLTLNRGDREGQAIHYLGLGRSPTWLDDDVYAYFLQEPGSDELAGGFEMGPALVEGRITSDTKAGIDTYDVIVTSERLRMAIPEPDRPDRLFIESAITSQDFPGRWYLIFNNINNPDKGTAYLFRYDRNSETVKLLQTIQGQALDYTTPNGHTGRYLAYLTYDGTDIRYMLLDTTNDTVKEYGQSRATDRSADGSWFLFAESNGLRIVSPEHGFEWTIAHNLQSCHAAVWINRE